MCFFRVLVIGFTGRWREMWSHASRLSSYTPHAGSHTFSYSSVRALRPSPGSRGSGQPLWPSYYLEKKPFTGKFSQTFSKTTHAHMETRLLCNFHEIWPTGSRWNRALFNGQKKFRLALPLPLLRGSHPKFVRDSSKQHTRSSLNFIQIRSLPAEL